MKNIQNNVEIIVFARRSPGAAGPSIPVSRKGKSLPLEAGRGEYSPPANHGRVTAEAVEREDSYFNIRCILLDALGAGGGG